MLSRRQFVKLGAGMGAGALLPLGMVDKVLAFNPVTQLPAMNPNLLPMFVDRLPIPNLMPHNGTAPIDYEIAVVPNKATVSSGMTAAVAKAGGGVYGQTNVWSYRPVGVSAYAPNLPVGTAVDATVPLNTYLGGTIVAPRNTPYQIKWVNALKDANGNPITHPMPVDPSLHWADPLQDSPPPPYPAGKGAPPFVYDLKSIPVVPHVHGAEVVSYADGGPEEWFTPDGIQGPEYSTWDGTQWLWKGDGDTIPQQGFCVYKYDNQQQAATIWYHDHALGITRLNVYMGMAGAYVIHDDAVENSLIAASVPSIFSGATDRYGQPFDIPIVIQDRMFDISGQLFYPAVSDNPADHPYWVPEFFGDTILVNGVVWPYLRVEPKPYRLRLLNGSNSRFYEMRFSASSGVGNSSPGTFHQIATDGAYLGQAATLNVLTAGPGERCEVVVDFSQFAGKTVTLNNNAQSPWPGGAPPLGHMDQIMQFRVDALPKKVVPVAWAPPATINSQLSTYAATGVPTLVSAPDPAPSVTRQLTLNEIMGAGGPLMAVLNNTLWPHYSNGMVMGPLTEEPGEYTTEYWQIVNLTADGHPIHVHLVNMQLISRQAFDIRAYTAAYNAAFPTAMLAMQPVGPPLALVADANNPMGYSLDVSKYGTPVAGATGPGGTPVIGGNPDVTPFLLGAPVATPMNERGWKDTIKVLPGEVTTFVTRWAPFGSNSLTTYPFDPCDGPGYVWHCHILDHEDNEMMRPYKVKEIDSPS